MGKYFRALLLIGMAISITACSYVSDLSEQVQIPDQLSFDGFDGRLLVWYTWEEPAATVLEDMLASFAEVNPDVRIVSEHVSIDQLAGRFEDQISAGLGPDLIIGPELDVVNGLIELNALVDLDQLEIDTELLLPAAVEAIRTEDGLYGIPISAHTNVLYYNKKKVPTPVTTLDQLIQAASEEQVVAIPTDFYHTFWGARAFEKELIDDDGKITIGNDFAHWLAWLLRAQEEPSIILSDDYDEMYAMFAEGRAAYFIGSSKEVPYLREALGLDNVGIALIPVNAATEDEDAADQSLVQQATIPEGSFLEVETISVNRLSTEMELAKGLVEFMINPIHQRELTATDLGHIPVSAKVRFDPRIPPAATTMIRQSSNTGVTPVELQPFMAELALFGDDVYTQLLEGVLTPEEATWRLAERVWTMNGGYETQ